MPVITVEWLEGRTAVQKDQLVKAITQACVEVVHISKDQVWVVFRDVKRSDWAMGGQLLGQETGAKGTLE